MFARKDEGARQHVSRAPMEDAWNKTTILPPIADVCSPG